MTEPASVLRLAIRLAPYQRRFQRRQRPDQHHRRVPLEQRQVRVHVVRIGDGVEQEIEAIGLLGHRRRIFRDQHLIRAEPDGILALGRRGGDHDHLGAESLGKLHPHVAQAAEADDAHPLAFIHLPVPQR